MLEVKAVKVLDDNYVWLLQDEATKSVAVVDPGETRPVVDELKQLGWRTPQIILNTHHHWDHVGGNRELQALWNCEIAASSYDISRIPGSRIKGYTEGQRVALGETTFQVIEVPGHTLGAIVYFSKESKVAIVGDTLFGMGCGRLFEGTPSMMHVSLKKIEALPDDTLILCGHDYTAANGRFALSVLPSNVKVEARVKAAIVRQKEGLPNVPFLLAEEKQTNPFLGVELSEFTRRRKLKDAF